MELLVFWHLSSPSPRPWARRWRTTNVCDAWPVRRQTYGYLPSHKASPPTGWYQIILFGDRGTCVLTTCPGLHSIAEWPGLDPVTSWSQIQHSNNLTTRPPNTKMFDCPNSLDMTRKCLGRWWFWWYDELVMGGVACFLTGKSHPARHYDGRSWAWCQRHILRLPHAEIVSDVIAIYSNIVLVIITRKL